MPILDRRVFCTAVAAGPAALLLPSLSFASPALPALDEETLQMLARTPGYAMVGEVRGRKVRELRGLRNAGATQPWDEQTLFPAASLSKSVFSFGVRKLARAGGFDLNRPLCSYMKLDLPGDWATSITGRHVLTHSSGLPNWIFDPKGELKQSFAPGTDWQYSGEGYVLLQRVLETVLRQPIGRFLGDLLRELGMKASTFTLTKPDEQRCAHGHERNGKVMEQSALFYDRRAYDAVAALGLEPETATTDEKLSALHKAGKPALRISITPNVAGSLWTTLDDFSRFLRALVSDLAAHPQDYQRRIAVNRVISWCDGMGMNQAGSTAWFQWGDSPGYKSLLWVEPGTRTHLAIFTNGERGAALYGWLLRQSVRGDRAALYWI